MNRVMGNSIRKSHVVMRALSAQQFARFKRRNEMKVLKVVTAALVCASMPWLMGCACKNSYACGGKVKHTQTAMLTAHTPVSDMPNAAPGECWAKCFIPPEVRTVSEQVCVKPASERLEIIPAEYEFVEEQVCVKPASVQLVEVPAQYETFSQTMVVEPGHTDWVREDSARCAALAGTPGGAAACDVFCLVSYPPVEKTIMAERLVRPASVREIEIPAEFQTIRSQRLVRQASCRRIEIPAEFATVEKTVKVGDGRWEWKRVVCERTTSSDTINNVKLALRKAGYTPSDTPGELDQADWVALKKYQTDNKLAVGALTLETMEDLGVSTP